MALVKKPESNHLISNSNHLKSITPEAKAFIHGAGEEATEGKARKKKVPVLLRIDSDLLQEIDQAAKELGLKRAAFIVSCAARRSRKQKETGAAP